MFAPSDQPQRLVPEPAVFLIEERNRCVPLDGVPDRPRQLINLIVGLHVGVRSTTVVHADNRSVRDRERVRTGTEQGAKTALQAYEEPASLTDVRG